MNLQKLMKIRASTNDLQVIFSGESTFNTNGSGDRKYVCRLLGEEFKPNSVILTIIQKGGGLRVGLGSL